MVITSATHDESIERCRVIGTIQLPMKDKAKQFYEARRALETQNKIRALMKIPASEFFGAWTQYNDKR